MTDTPSPREVITQLLDGIAQRRWSELHDLFADDAVIDYPFALPTPRRLTGREEIRAYFAASASYPLVLQSRNVVMHTTSDAAIVTVQWDYDVLVTTTGRTFQVANIQVSTVRNGRIVASCDYHNHVMLAAAVGRLPALLAALPGVGAGT